MKFYSTEMQNLSKQKTTVDNIRIVISDGLSGEYYGDARITSFDNIWVEMPDVTGRYKLKSRAVKELERHFITNLDTLFHKAWLVSDGDWILRNIEAVRVK